MNHSNTADLMSSWSNTTQTQPYLQHTHTHTRLHCLQPAEACSTAPSLSHPWGARISGTHIRNWTNTLFPLCRGDAAEPCARHEVCLPHHCCCVSKGARGRCRHRDVRGRNVWQRLCCCYLLGISGVFVCNFVCVRRVACQLLLGWMVINAM